MLAWMPSIDKQGRQRALEWNVLEIIGSRLEYRATEILVQESGSLWPVQSLPEPYQDGASFTITREGDVRWRFATDPPKRGMIDRDP